jgi:hypothetical protein
MTRDEATSRTVQEKAAEMLRRIDADPNAPKDNPIYEVFKEIQALGRENEKLLQELSDAQAAFAELSATLEHYAASECVSCINLRAELAAYRELIENVEELELKDQVKIFRGRHDWCINDLDSTDREALVLGYFNSPLEAFNAIQRERATVVSK